MLSPKKCSRTSLCPAAAQEVGWDRIAEDHPPWAIIVGLNVCVLPQRRSASFAALARWHANRGGWLGYGHSAKRGSKAKDNQQINVFGHWFGVSRC